MAQLTAKGDLALEIDEDELEASLTFTPSKEGAEWTAAKILRVLMDARIGGFNQKQAEELVQKFGRAKGKAKEIVATGVPPEMPQREMPAWADIPMPPELAALASSTAAEAPPPILYKVKFETIKIEKTVKKPAFLPFLRPKFEKVQVTERREKREQVFPDTTVQRTGWARRGECIGTLSQAKPGKAGKNLYGKPLQPPSDDGAFFTGPGVLRNKNELMAEWDGVTRIGDRWVDIVPFSRHVWSIEVSPNGATYFLNYTPGDNRIPGPGSADILARARELGAVEDGLVGPEELASALGQAVSRKEALLRWSISKDRDAKVEVKVSPDGIKATLSIWKGRGRGRPLDLSAVSAALKDSRVRGLKPEELKRDVLAFYKGKKPELIDYPLAEGRAPGRGKNRTFALSVPLLPEEKAEELRMRFADQTGIAKALPSLADFPIAEAAKIAKVQLGQTIGELPPSGVGQDGVDVFGKVLLGIQGNDPSIKTYENIDFGRDKLVATATGLLLANEMDNAWKLRVLRFRDAAIDVSIAADSMSASVTLVAEEGFGSPLSVEKVLSALSEKAVAQGLEPYSIAEAVSDAREGKPVSQRVVARGKSARPGGSVTVTWLVHKSTGALYTIHDGNRADFKERDTMTRVAAGDQILTLKKAADAGEDGFDVLGRPIKAGAASSGDSLPEHDETIREELAEDGSTYFVAAVGGELLVEASPGSKGRVSISERLAVRGNVGPETGNIKFPGAVQVSGSVLSGFSLVAGGDVTIAGAIEASLLSSDGNVRVAEGIKGGRKGTIRARLSIDAAFAEQALLLAVEDIRIKSGCVLCNVKTNGRLIIAAEKGSLIGGLCKARKGIDVAMLGSETFTKTEVSFGQDYLVADQIDAEEREISKLNTLILQTDRTMADLEKAGAGLDRIRQDKAKLLRLLEKRTIRVFGMREKFEAHVASELRIRGTVFPGVILESHNRFFEVRSRKTRVVFSFDKELGQIIERPL
jgi:uncharacterized protein (DUF342 family)